MTVACDVTVNTSRATTRCGSHVPGLGIPGRIALLKLLNRVLGRQRLDSTGACILFLLLLSTFHRRDYVEETHTRFVN